MVGLSRRIRTASYRMHEFADASSERTLLLRRADGARKSNCVVFSVGNRNQKPADASLGRPVSRGVSEKDSRFPAGFVEHLEIDPLDPFGPTGTEGLENRLLGCPATCEVRRGVLVAPAVLDLRGSEYLFQKMIAMAIDHLSDSRALNDVGTDSDQLHGRI